jgi:hypothetical protein
MAAAAVAVDMEVSPMARIALDHVEKVYAAALRRWTTCALVTAKLTGRKPIAA